MNRLAVVVSAVAVGAASTAHAASNVASDFTYLALGDSLAWGFTFLEAAPPNAGDQGYARGVADGLALRNGGVRPTRLNLGVPGDTSANFFSGGEFGALLNTNDPPMLPTPSQNSLFQQTLAQADTLPGGPIEFVTLQLGVNDLFDLIDSVDGFLDRPIAERLDLARAELANIEANLTTIMTDLRATLPGADVRVVGYFDRFAAFLTQPERDPFFDAASPEDGPGLAIAELAQPLLPELNAMLENLAADYGATFVPTDDLFAGREFELTFIETISLDLPNFHPTDEGYALIAERILAAPAPGATMVMVIGAIGCRRRRSRSI